MFKYKKGFTLAELMMCLLIMGAIAAMILPNVKRINPSKNQVLVKKAYVVSESIISDLMSDNNIYPQRTDRPQDFAFYDDVQDTNDKFSDTGKKFCLNFAKRLNTKKEDAYCEGDFKFSDFTGEKDYKHDFVTTDGIVWTFSKNPICDPDFDYVGEVDSVAKALANKCVYPAEAEKELSCDLDSSTPQPYMCLYIDVNGSESGADAPKTHLPNEFTGDTLDRYVMIIHSNGKVQVKQNITDSKASDALKIIQKNKFSGGV